MVSPPASSQPGVKVRPVTGLPPDVINTSLWIADIDNELNEKGYIIPGLGDAGDLAFGQKM